MKKSADRLLITVLILSILIAGIVSSCSRINNVFFSCDRIDSPTETILTGVVSGCANRDAKNEELSELQFRVIPMQAAHTACRNLVFLLLCGGIGVTAMTLCRSDYYRIHILRRNAVFLSTGKIVCYILRQDGMK